MKTDKDKRNGESRFSQYHQVNSDLAKLIIEYAAPMLEHCTTFETRQDAISYAILCWNLSLEDEAERKIIEEQIASQYPVEKKEEILRLIDFLIKRKDALYADNRFYVIDYEITRRGENLKLEVSSKYLPRNPS
ncbi:hypothetical protein JXO59_00070 [candidate division KSB1 bacterium]|nr:hypothetical protein [candidate division KSB1 bacterium]